LVADDYSRVAQTILALVGAGALFFLDSIAFDASLKKKTVQLRRKGRNVSPNGKLS